MPSRLVFPLEIDMRVGLRPGVSASIAAWEMQSFRRDIPDAEGKRQPESH